MAGNSAAPKPIALTMGEPAGIGPELIASLWKNRGTETPPFFMIGHADAIRPYAPSIPIQDISSVADAASCFNDALPILSICDGLDVQPGRIVAENSPAVIRAIDRAVHLALSKEIKAIVTAPIHKAALAQAGFSHPGHTDYLADLSGRPGSDAVMMLANDALRAVPVLVHLSLKDSIKTLTTEIIVKSGLITAIDLRDRFGIKHPRLAVAGLNPHAGEDGLLGLEDALIIKPAVDQLNDMGINAFGPLPADTMFHEEARETYDVALCMYHDQALIPVKTLDFHGGVNVTLGLPFVRTSPDHGTALSIAGTGKANPRSMTAALAMAASMSDNA